MKEVKICLLSPEAKRIEGFSYGNKTYECLKEDTRMFLSKKVNRFKKQGGKDVTILVGSGLGFDILAFEVASMVKSEYADSVNVKVELCIAYEFQYKRWSAEDVHRHMNFLRLSDDVVFVDQIPEYLHPSAKIGSKHKSKHKMRNKYMVDESDFVVCLWDGDRSTQFGECIAYALKNRKGFKNLYRKETDVV